MLLLPETEGLEVLPNNLRVSFFIHGASEEIGYSQPYDTNWRDLPLLIMQQFEQNTLGLMVLRPDQADALQPSAHPPMARLLFQHFEDTVPNDVQISLPTDRNALFCNQEFQVWRKRIVAQSVTSCSQPDWENTCHLLGISQHG
jgi:hypothetical protein